MPVITFKHLGILSLVAMAACGRSPLRDGTGNLPLVQPETGLPACEQGLTQCGTRNVSLCYDLRRSPDHCGACEHACPLGIACQSGACQQVSCKGPLSFKALAAVDNRSMEVDPPYLPTLGDFDGDGILDLAGTPAFNDPGGILAGAHVFVGTDLRYGAGDGTFPTARRLDNTRIQHWTNISADLDSDGTLDLVSVHSDHPAVTVRRGSGKRDAPFGEAEIYPTSQTPDSVLLADLDSDGHPDLVAGVESKLEIWRMRGSVRFEPSATLPTRGSSPTLMAVDWNHDGALDLAYGANSLNLRYGRGDGSFDPEIVCGLALSAPHLSQPAALFRIAADLDHDNVIDLVGQTNVFLGLDDCTPSKIAPTPGWALGPIDSTLAIADVNGDGDLDILTGSKVYLGDGQGSFASPFTLPLNTATDALLVGDLNRDGKLDVIASGYQGRQVFLNTCQ